MKRTTATRSLLITLLLTLVLFALAGPALAADTRNGDVISVDQGTTLNDNLYVSGRTINIDGTVKGDVTAVGQTVTVNGTVEGNLIVAAQTVTLNGTVRDAIVAAQSFELGPNAHVTGNVNIAGANLESKQGSAIDGDLAVFANQALIAGRIGRDVIGGMNGLELRGVVGRNMTVGVGEKGSTQFMPSSTPNLGVKSGLVLVDGAQVGGKLEYGSPSEATISPGAKVAGSVTRKETRDTSDTSATTTTSVVLSVVQRFVTLLLIGLLLIWLAPAWLRRLDDTIQAKPLSSLGFGLLALIIFLVVLVLIPVIGILVALLLGLLSLSGIAWFLAIASVLLDAIILVGFLVFVVYVAEVLISFLVGRWVLQRFQPSLAEGRVLPFVLGLVLFVIVTAIPLLGDLIGFVAVLLGLGALWLWLRPGRPHTAVVTSPSPAVS